MSPKVQFAACLAVPLALLLGASASAQTAPAVTDAPVASAPDGALDAQIAAYLNASSQAAPVKGASPASPLETAPPDRAPHGEVGVGIGTGGYREVHGSLVAPVGSTGTVALAFGQVRGRGYWGPADEGPGSVAGFLDNAVPADPLRPRAETATAAPACPSATDKGADKKVGSEPLWVNRLRAANPVKDCPH